MVIDVTKLDKDKNLEDMVIFCDKENFVYISLGGGEYEKLHVNVGINTIISTCVDRRLQFYEVYLIRKLELSNTIENSSLRDCLEQFYIFIACFDIYPYVYKKIDNNILYNDDEDEYYLTTDASNIKAHTIVDKYYAIFNRIKSELTITQRNKIFNDVVRLIKDTCKSNEKDLNARIVDMINMDDTFKQIIMENTVRPL
jgi:hypothetical protein